MDKSEQPKIFGAIVEDSHVRELVAARFTGNASPEQLAQLSELIAKRPEVRDFYIAHSALVGQLTAYTADVASLEFADADAKNGAQSSSLSFPMFPRASTAIITLSAVVVLVASTMFWGEDYWNAKQPHLAADVVGQVRMDSFDGPASELHAGQMVSVENGECEVRLDNGVELLVYSPAEFSIETPMQCRLLNGRLTADVPPQAIGFRVLTDHADIVDQGTRFGVAVENDTGTSIAVFEGLVDVASHDQPLEVGRAVSISPDGKLSRLQFVTPDTFESSEESIVASAATITAVRDNIRTIGELGFYRIVPGGFGEDQQAYVDRVHQWNGLSENGLPSELVGGDYVMPFNDDKLEENFEITVTLSRMTNLYVLFDKRNETPQWLERDFVDSGVSVGQDEGQVPGNKTRMETDVGSGRSIDNEFAVWKSRKPVVGDVTLQGLWNGVEQAIETDDSSLQNKRSMYGILAVPLQNN